MISVCMLGGQGLAAAGVAGYYLTPDRSCGLGYYTEHHQFPGRWVGDGAEALSLSGPLGQDGAARLQQLLNAETPDGQSLARPVWRPDPAGRLPSGPLLEAFGQVARGKGVPLEELFTDPTDRAALLGIIRRSNVDAALPALAGELATPAGPLATGRRARTGAGSVDAAVAGHLASTAGLVPVELFREADGTDRYTPALAKAGGRIDVRRVGIDVTVSAPKSVSVLQALADPETAALIEACHDRAVEQALGYLQRQGGHGFRGHHGDGHVLDRVTTDGWIAAGFIHYTSRAGDPQLHTHLVVPNLLHGQDGKWSAIDSRAVFRQAKTAGYLYQAALRHELTRELGVEWTPPVKGQSDIVGVPRQVLREFSERRRQIESVLSRTGGTGRAAAQAACLSTRQRKKHLSIEVLREDWTARLHALGTSSASVIRAARMNSPRWRQRQRTPSSRSDALQLTATQLAEVAALVLGPDGVTAKATGFDRRDLLQALAVTLPWERTGASLELEHLADQLLTHPAAVPLEVGEGQDCEEERRWTTLELLATEQHALTLAARTTSVPMPTQQDVDAQLACRPWLSHEQRVAVRSLGADDRLATVLVGPAGSGKTAVLTALKALAHERSRPVVGCALAALTARRLEQGSGIPSSSLAQLLARLDNNPEHGLQPGTLVVLDEAGMVGTRHLARLLEHVDSARGQLLLVGDPAQLPEIDAGGMFRHLSDPERHPAVLRGNQRQENVWEIGALERLRAGHHSAALSSYVQHGRVASLHSREAMHAQIAQDYLAATEEASTSQQIRETVVLASQHADVDALNEHIREGLQERGRLGPDRVTLELPQGPVGFSPGDQVIITRPCRDTDGRKVLNGTRGQLRDLHESGLQVQLDNGATFTLSPETSIDCLRHGYALTIHKAQGLTATTALVASDGLTGNAAYTALSRGRERNQLYLHDDDPNTGERDWQQAFARLCDQLGRPTGDTLASRQVRGSARPLARPAAYEAQQYRSPGSVLER